MDLTRGSNSSSTLSKPIEGFVASDASRTRLERPPDISVVISTHNRASELEATLPALFKQDLDPARFEVIVVDNNSSDDTPDAIRRLGLAHPRLRAFRESRPGVSNGRNCGILNSRADLVAITDDDTEVAADWLSTILRSFSEHPTAAFVGGPVVPRWHTPPPPWLTKRHWGPLAVVDYGNRPLILGKEHRLCLLTANFAVRMSALRRVGLFAPEFRRCQDFELQFRMWEAGLHGVYDPAIAAATTVPEERLAKSYHRMWYRRNARYHAMMPAAALLDRVPENKGIISWLDVPLFVFRQAAQEAAAAFWSYATGRSVEAFEHETHAWYLFSYARARLWRYFARMFAKGHARRPAAASRVQTQEHAATAAVRVRAFGEAPLPSPPEVHE
jgi:glycosyltransferase involved in cell wall biosynthesis